jgi:hypothetical protein
VVGVSINTVTKLPAEAGEACLAYHDENVKALDCKRVQCDEIWSFVYAKEKNAQATKTAPTFAGDVWTWTSICEDSKRHVRKRSSHAALVSATFAKPSRWPGVTISTSDRLGTPAG